MSKTECNDQSKCTGGDDCKDITCGELKEAECYSFSTKAYNEMVYCYWNGDSCDINQKVVVISLLRMKLLPLPNVLIMVVWSILMIKQSVKL